MRHLHREYTFGHARPRRRSTRCSRRWIVCRSERPAANLVGWKKSDTEKVRAANFLQWFPQTVRTAAVARRLGPWAWSIATKFSWNGIRRTRLLQRTLRKELCP